MCLCVCARLRSTYTERRSHSNGSSVCLPYARAPSGNRPSPNSIPPFPSFFFVCVCSARNGHPPTAAAVSPRTTTTRHQHTRSLTHSGCHRASTGRKKATQLLRFEFSRAGTEPPSSPCCFLLYFLFSPPPPFSHLCRVALLCTALLFTSLRPLLIIT